MNKYKILILKYKIATDFRNTFIKYNSCKAEVKRRIAFQKNKSVLTYKQVLKKKKYFQKHLFIWSVILYGSGSWTLCKKPEITLTLLKCGFREG